MNRQELLLRWVKSQHEGQLIRLTELPYIDHLIDVAELSDVELFGYEVGLCHDLFEKASVTKIALKVALQDFGYDHAETALISDCVDELTDKFTKEAYPKLDKKTRKQKEADRLAGISALAQTVKYADLIYNINWMLIHDRKHATKYLKRKKTLLLHMKNGNQVLLCRAVKLIDTYIIQL